MAFNLGQTLYGADAKVRNLLGNVGQAIQSTVKSYLPGFGAGPQYGQLPNKFVTTQQPVPKTTLPTGRFPTSTSTSGGIGGGFGGISPSLIGTENVFDPNSFDWEGMFAPAFGALD